MVILGLDPGLASTGFGAIGCERGGRRSFVKCGCIKTAPSEHVSRRLFRIHSDIDSLLGIIRPDLVAVENIFSLIRYPKAGIMLGGVMGIIYLSVYNNNLPLVELAPREVKSSLAGHGAADKRQIREAVKKTLKLSGIKSLHASDALAVALAASYRKGYR